MLRFLYEWSTTVGLQALKEDKVTNFRLAVNASIEQIKPPTFEPLFPVPKQKLSCSTTVSLHP